MERVNRILNNPSFRTHLRRTVRKEKNRKFCKHDLQHALDVARIAYIMTLESGLGVAKEVVYAAALLHDIGKWVQLERGTPHQISSAELAADILDEAGYTEQEKLLIRDAILNHRTRGMPEGSFDAVIYQADKRSRNCFGCIELERCDWSTDKKNFGIVL